MSERDQFTTYSQANLSERCYMRLSKLVYDESGIRLPIAKKTLMESRLQRRLRQLQLSDFDQYCEYLFDPDRMQHEIVSLINVISTNKTEFFRESGHFDYLSNIYLKEYIKHDLRRPLRVWSAGCSTGEEPYTLAMVLSEFAAKNPGFHFSILATDISTTVLEKAVKAVYDEDAIEPISMDLRRKYLLRGKSRNDNVVRIAPEIRGRVQFGRLNFIDDDYGMGRSVDIIFCRNVIIYFDKPTQEKILNKFCRTLTPGGYLFLGHSESTTGLNVPLERKAASIFRLK